MTAPVNIPTRAEILAMDLPALARVRAELTAAVQQVQFTMDARKTDFLSEWHSEPDKQEYYAWLRRAKGFRVKAQNALTLVRAQEKALNIALSESKVKAFANAEAAWIGWADKYDYDPDDGELHDAFVAGWKNGYSACADQAMVGPSLGITEAAS